MVVRLLAVISLLAYSGLAFSQVSADGYNCPEDAGGVNSCTANEVNIANTTEVFTDALVCPEGEQILITGIRARYGLNTGLRYDPLLWIGQTGTDPRESGGSCFVSSAPEFAGEADLFQDLDGDSCLDITDPGDYDTVPDPVELDYEELNFLIDCQDADEDGTADVHVVVTWLQNTSLQCGTGPGQSFAPGAPSKCDYNLIPLNIPYVGPKPTLTIIKNVVNDNGGTATSAEWTMDITGGDPSQNNFPGAPAPGVTVTINADEAYSVDESGGPDGYSKSLSPGCSGTLGSGEMATCIITNDDIAPELTVIKHVDNSLGGSAVASAWDMIVTALNPSDDIFPGSEAGVTITIDANSPYSVDESTGPADYIKTIGPGCSGTLLPGEVASCTITNTHPGPNPMLKVIKEVVNNNGGDAVPSDWQMDITATNPSDNNFPGSEAGVTISIEPGAYSVSESLGQSGYAASFSAGCSGTLALNEMATCTITNDDIAPELTIIKHVVNTGGGTAVAGDWNMIVTANNPSDNNFPGSEAGVTITIDANAPYSVDENDGPDDYSKTIGPGCSGTLLPGETSECTITNTYVPQIPRLTLNKVVINDNGGNAEDADWILEAAGPDSIAGVEGSAAVTDAPVDEGDYALSEPGPDGYELVDISCSGGVLDEETSILTLVQGDDVTCTFTNDDIAPELTITKHVVNIGGGTAVAADWNMLINPSANPSDNNFPGSEAGVSITIDANTPYNVDESPGPDNYVKTIGAGCSGELEPGDTADCTITNTYGIDLPVLTLLKDVINEVDGVEYGKHMDTDWILSAGGPVVRVGVEGDAEVTGTTVLPGSYVLSELGPEGYTASDWQCDGGSLDADMSILDLANGDDVTCTITNTVIPPELKLIKEVVGGTAGPDDFGISVNDDEVLSGDFYQYPAHEPLEIDEDGYTDYVFAGISGDSKCPMMLKGTLQLDEGESVTCTITNVWEPDPPVLTLVKVVINDDGGDQLITDWTLMADGLAYREGPTGSEPVTNTEVLPGTYTLSEVGPPGYEASDWMCEGGLLVGNQLTLTFNEVVTCTITNDDIAPTITLIKKVFGGGAGPDDFGVSVDGNVVLSGVEYEYLANDPMVIDENDLTDYVLVNIIGDDNCPPVLPGVVELDEGEELSCTINNIFHIDPPVLTLVKDVINDDGGDQLDTDWTLIADGPAYREGIEGSEPVTASKVLPGTYSLEEEGPPGYTAGDWQCNGGLLIGNQLTLVDGEVVTCMVVNDDQPGKLTVTKVVEGGSAEADDFALTVNGSGVLSGETIEYPSNMALSIDEADLPNYVFEKFSGSDKCPLALGGSVSLDEGEHVSCTITNIHYFTPGSLTLRKSVINDDGGSRVDTDWQLEAFGPVVRVGKDGSDAVTGSPVLPGTYTLSESGPGGYTASGWSCSGGALDGDQLTIEDNESATCTITNDDIDYSTAPDISMTKTVNGLVEGCPAIIGEDLSFTITVLNQGPGSIGNIVLDDHWSWQLDATALPDGLDCSQPEMRSLLCNLGSHSPGDSTVIDLDFTVSGNPGEEICNTAVVSTTPLETINTSNNESAVCLSLSGLLELESAVLPPALVANDYNQAIGISGGLQPFSVSLSGLPPGLSWSLDGNQILIQGCPGATGLSVFTAEVENEASCQNTGRAFTLSVESDPECPLSEFSSMAVDEVGTPDSNSGLPDESFQKIAVDEDENRYLVGYVNNAQRNYDIRLIKYSPSGSMLWDKTYDTGSHDLGYAVNVSPDGERVYVGGTTMMVTSNQLWWDAMLLELDASSGCTVGEHFQSAGTATSSTYYDIASNAEAVYAVGEQQVNADKPGGPHQSGGLVSVFSQQSRQLAGSCSDRVSISDSSSDELSWQWTRVREGASPTVAYSVQLPDVECEGCDILVGGADGANGWVDILNVTSQGLESFLSPSAISVQDMTVPGNDRIIIGGSSTTNAMKILAYDRSGTSVWSQTSLGQGRLRALATDMHGMIYAVGKNMESQPTGLLFKLNPAGNTIDSRTLTQGGGLSFHDLAVPRPGGGVIGAQARRTHSDFSWQLLDFICGGSCSPGSQIGE